MWIDGETGLPVEVAQKIKERFRTLEEENSELRKENDQLKQRISELEEENQKLKEQVFKSSGGKRFAQAESSRNRGRLSRGKEDRR